MGGGNESQGKLLELPDSKGFISWLWNCVHTTVENFQNNISHTEECPQFSLGECGQFPQHNLLLPDKDLMIETDIVMDWLIEGVWEASTQTDALPRGDERWGASQPPKALELGFT